MLIHPRLPSRWDKNGGLERLDHGGTRDLEPGGHPFAVVDGRVDDAGFAKPDLALGFDRVRSAMRHGVPDYYRRRRVDRGDARADDLDRLTAIVVPISVQVTLVEGVRDLRERGGLDRAACNRHLEFVRLTRVTRVDGAREAPPLRRDTRPLEHRRSFFLERGKDSR